MKCARCMSESNKIEILQCDICKRSFACNQSDINNYTVIKAAIELTKLMDRGIAVITDFDTFRKTVKKHSDYKE